jgi:modulator of FtsH protease
MGDWQDFLVTAAQAAAALAGLMFVGLSINLEMIMDNPRYGWAGRALEALVLLVAVLIVTCLLVAPAPGTVVAGLEVLVIGIADWAAIVVIQLLQLRNWHSLEATLRPYFVTRVVLGQIATLPLVAAGIAVLSWGVSGLYVLAAGVLLSFLVSGANAWILLVEIQR